MLARLQKTNGNLHQKKIRPLDALCHLLRAVTKIPTNSIPAALVADFKQFDLACTLLRNLAQTDAKTTDYLYEDEDREQRDKAKAELVRIREQFNSDTLRHQRQLAMMESDLRQLHLEIMEYNRANSILEEKKLVKEQELYQQITADTEEEKNEYHSQNCCYKYILCCFALGKVNATKQAVAKLKDEQQKLLSSDPTANNTKTIATITLQRDQLYRQLKELMAHPPELHDEAVSIRLGQAIAKIEEGETHYYTEVSRRLMFQLVRVDALYKLLAQKLDEFSAATPNNKKSPLLSPLREKFAEHAEKVNELINQFWCSTPAIHDAIYYKDIFNKLSDAEQAAILAAESITSELLEKVIVTHAVMPVRGMFIKK